MLQIDLTSTDEATLRAEAGSAGLELTAFIAQLLRRRAALRRMDEVMAPVREEAATASEDEVFDLVEQARQEAWQARQQRREP